MQEMGGSRYEEHACEAVPDWPGQSNLHTRFTASRRLGIRPHEKTPTGAVVADIWLAYW